MPNQNKRRPYLKMFGFSADRFYYFCFFIPFRTHVNVDEIKTQSVLIQDDQVNFTDAYLTNDQLEADELRNVRYITAIAFMQKFLKTRPRIKDEHANVSRK